MLDNNSESDQPQYLQQPNKKILVANLTSYSSFFSLKRSYLSIPLEKAKYIQPVHPKGVAIGKPYLLQVEQVGNSVAGSLNQPFTTLQTVLSTCHNPGRYALVSIISSDGRQNRVYLGLRSRYTMDSDVVENVGKFLQGNWQGTKCHVVYPEDQHFQEYIQEPLNKKFQYAYALTGIPSLNSGDSTGYPQTLDRLLRGMRGKSFMYMVIAEPMPETEVNEIIYRLRELMGYVHSLSKITFSETSTVGQSQTQSKTASLETSQATAESQSKTNQVTDTSNTSIAMTLTDGLSALVNGEFIKQLIPSVAFLADVVDAARNLAPELTRTWQASEGITQTFTKTKGWSRSETTESSQSTAQTFGQEYINAHAQAAEAQIEKYIERFELARALGCWNVGVYLLAENQYILQNISAQLRSLLSGNNSVLEPIRIHNLQPVWSNSGDIPGAEAALRKFDQPSLGLVNLQDQDRLQQINHPLGKVFNGLTTPLNNQELALLVNLPRHELPGVSVMPTATFSLNPPVVEDKAITLGRLLEGGERINLSYKISCKNLAKHCLVTGLKESGKSTTCKRILNELNEQQIPFLIIEPAQEEYVEWAMKTNEALPPDSPERIAIYIPGIQTWRGYNLENQLTLNPFDIVWLAEKTTPHILSHIDRLKFILSATFPIHEALPLLLEEAVFNVYSHSQNWLADQLPPFGTSYPTLTEFINQIQAIAQEKGYEQQIIAALTTRIQSLQRGWKKQLFDQPQSTPLAKIFDRPTVINLSYLSDDTEKAFAMALLLQFLYEYRQAHYELMGEEERQNHHLRHLTVIEEAHRLLLRTTPSQSDPANSQGKVAEMFASILSQIRAYDQGLLLAEQLPTRLIPNAIKNINLKIVHRLVAADDRDAMSACMNLTPDQSAIINHLHLGQAIICGEQDNMAAWVDIECPPR